MFWAIVWSGVAALAVMPATARAAEAPAPALVVSAYRASSFNPALGTGLSPWCAAETAPDSGKVTLDGPNGAESFDDWWEADFQPGQDTVGAILMRSGLLSQGRVVGHRIRDFTWAYQKRGEAAWHRIAETDLYANRAQLIFRFAPIAGVARLRLLIRPRSAAELSLAGSNAPCLREARFFAASDARIPTEPWFYAVATWEEGNPYLPLLHWGEPFDPYPGVQQALTELRGAAGPDATDELWVGDWGDWVMHEPAPAGFLLSGNYKDWDQVNPAVYGGFYRFIRQTQGSVPVLGACGGHQLLAMVMEHPDPASFGTEFEPDNLSQAVITCSTVPQYQCGGEGPVDCCQEATVTADQPFKWLSANVPGSAMPNPYQSPRVDMLFNLLSEREGTTGIRAWLHHVDFVEPSKAWPYFDIIATYPSEVSGLSRDNPALVQGMRLREGVLYGTQFHWDEEHIGRCGREDWERDMERVLKNFVGIALSRTSPGRPFEATVSSGEATAANLFDLDRASLWCADGTSGDVTLKFPKDLDLSAVGMVEGDTPAQAAAQSYRFDVSEDGRAWTQVAAARGSLYALQRQRVLSCDPQGEPLPGAEDGQSTLTRLGGAAGSVRGRYLRIHVTSASGRPACLREIQVYGD